MVHVACEVNSEASCHASEVSETEQRERATIVGLSHPAMMELMGVSIPVF